MRRKLRVVSDGNALNTRIETDTGELIEGVVAVQITITQYGGVQVDLKLENVEIDVVGEEREVEKRP